MDAGSGEGETLGGEWDSKMQENVLLDAHMCKMSHQHFLIVFQEMTRCKMMLRIPIFLVSV